MIKGTQKPQHRKWEKSQFDNFMTEKEKNYVSNIFRKKINTMNKIYNVEIFFSKDLNVTEKQIEVKEFQIPVVNGTPQNLLKELKDIRITPTAEKDKNDASTDRKNLKTKKISFIKSLKLPRLMLESDVAVVDDIAVKFKIELMIDEFICKKYMIRESKLQDFIKENANRIHEFFKVAKFRKLLRDIIEDDDEETKKIVILALLLKSQLIVDYGKISEFFDYLVAFTPKIETEEILKVRFIDNFMFNLPGVLLATLLLINQEELAPLFFDSLKFKIEYLFDVELKFVWRFLAILYINLIDEQKQWLIDRLRDKISDVAFSQDQARIDDMGPFLEALGLDSEAE